MSTPPRLSPVLAPVQGLFNRHVFGRPMAPDVAAVASTPQSTGGPVPAAELGDDEADDLAQRVRNVGEW